MKEQKKEYEMPNANVFHCTVDMIRTSGGGAETEGQVFSTNNTETKVGDF